MSAPTRPRLNITNAQRTLAQQARAWADAMETMEHTSNAAQELFARSGAITEGTGEVADALTEEGK